jgi:hypothetical protein
MKPTQLGTGADHCALAIVQYFAVYTFFLRTEGVAQIALSAAEKENQPRRNEDHEESPG